MKVAFVSVVPSPYQRDLFNALAARPELDEMRVYYLSATAPGSPWPQPALADHERLLPGKAIPIGQAQIEFNWRLPDFSRFDLVVLNSLTSVTAQWLMRRGLRDKPWIFWGEILRDKKPGWRKRFQDGLTGPLQRAAAIAAIGSWAGRDYRRRFPHVPMFNIPYHCDLAPFLHVPRQPEPSLTFLFCGQMIRRKAVDLLLAAFEKVVCEGLDVRLLLVGREAELPEMLCELQPRTRARIDYAGFQAPQALPEFFARADAFVLPSRHDGWGVVVNQAIGAGLPVICSDRVGAGYDLVRDGVNGFVFEAGNTKALAERLALLARDRQLCAQMGEASRAISADWVPERGAGRWIAAFQMVLARPEAQGVAP